MNELEISVINMLPMLVLITRIAGIGLGLSLIFVGIYQLKKKKKQGKDHIILGIVTMIFCWFLTILIEAIVDMQLNPWPTSSGGFVFPCFLVIPILITWFYIYFDNGDEKKNNNVK